MTEPAKPPTSPQPAEIVAPIVGAIDAAGEARTFSQPKGFISLDPRAAHGLKEP